MASSSPGPKATEATASHTPDVRPFAGLEGWFGLMLGLKDTRALRADRDTGNDAEICERNLDVNSRRGIPHGLNQLWSMGVALYAPPILRRRSCCQHRLTLDGFD